MQVYDEQEYIEQYTIRFKGECIEGQDKETVCRNVARIFQARRRDVADIVFGDAVFIRRNLNFFTAQQYHHAFSKSGAVCEWLPETKQENPALFPIAFHDKDTREQSCRIPRHAASSSDSGSDKTANSTKTVCPKCGHEQPRGEECISCGIIFEKFFNHQRNKNNSSQKAQSQETERTGSEKDIATHVISDQADEAAHAPTVIEEEYRKAMISLRYGSAFFIGIFFIDSLARRWGLDITVWPYILASLFLCHGCWFLAQTKGYPGVTGLLGITNLFGLSVLFLLPDKKEKMHAYHLDRIKISAITMMLLSVYWFSGYLNRHIELRQFIRQSARMRDSRHVYPSTVLDTDPAIHSNETKKMKEFVQQGMTMLTKHDYRPDNFERVLNLMFQEVTEFFVWMQYQQFLHAPLQETEILAQFTSESIGTKQQDFFNLFSELISNDDGLHSHPVIKKVYSAWIEHCTKWDWILSGCGGGESRDSNRLYDMLFAVQEAYRNRNFMRRSLIASRGEQALEEENVPLNLPSPSEDFISFMDVTDKGVHAFRISDKASKDMAGKTLVMAYYSRPYKRNKTINYIDTFVCIGGDLSKKILAGDYKIFNWPYLEYPRI